MFYLFFKTHLEYFLLWEAFPSRSAVMGMASWALQSLLSALSAVPPLPGKFPGVYWNRPPKEGAAKTQKKESDTSRIKQFIKGAYGQKQSLGWQQDGGSSHQKGDGGLIHTHTPTKNTGGL